MLPGPVQASFGLAGLVRRAAVSGHTLGIGTVSVEPAAGGADPALDLGVLLTCSDQDRTRPKQIEQPVLDKLGALIAIAFPLVHLSATVAGLGILG